MAMTSFAPQVDENTKASILVDLIVLAHHSFIGKKKKKKRRKNRDGGNNIFAFPS
jgi:hypothetical protein